MRTSELVKVMRNNPHNAKYLRQRSTPRKEYNGSSGGLYNGEGRGYYISSGEKAVGAVTNLAESKI